jgi:hypothetical protein
MRIESVIADRERGYCRLQSLPLVSQTGVSSATLNERTDRMEEGERERFG